MKKVLFFVLVLLCAAVSADARLRSGPSTGPVFPTCVGTPTGATKVANNATFSYLGWTWAAQNPVSVALNGTVFTAPICGGIWRDDVDTNIIHYNNFSQEYQAFDQARQTRSEIVPSVATNAVPTFGTNTTYVNTFDIYVDALTNIVGSEFQTLSQIHGGDSRYGPEQPPNPVGSTSGVPISAVAAFSVEMTQATPGAQLTLRTQVAWGLNVQNQGTFNGNPAATILGTSVSMGAFDTWHTIKQVVNDSHGYTGRYNVSLNGTPITTYSGATGFEFVDLVANYGPVTASFTGSISGTTLTTSSGTGFSVGRLISGASVAANTVITGGSGLSWTVSVSQSVASETMNVRIIQPVNSYQKIGQYWGMFNCASTGPEPWCHYPPVGTRFIGKRRNEIQVYLNYSAIADTGVSTGAGTNGVSYSKSLVLTRGSTSTGTPVYGISGSVPGLSLNTGTGAYTGTPTTPGAYVVTFTMTDNQGVVDSLPITITIS